MLATVAGAFAVTAANVGLVVAIVLLTVHGWLAVRSLQFGPAHSSQTSGQ
jgi:uncharacterized membrane protein YjgN (DUF898 family)